MDEWVKNLLETHFKNGVLDNDYTPILMLACELKSLVKEAYEKGMEEGALNPYC